MSPTTHFASATIVPHPARSAGLAAGLTRNRDRLILALGAFADAARTLLPETGDEPHVAERIADLRHRLCALDFSVSGAPAELASRASDLDALTQVARYLIQDTASRLGDQYGDRAEPILAALRLASFR